ncbi:hypothetical protein BABINDRAFT_161837 [Babjeviella inositovora NRRL Y-12698]|uniref:Transcription factor MBP1 n=1 Tax=Babjeviella inositovora NRRL Y-12698 TaxID=984486 RepID=A0A1E3QR53_9ASCO|nr:uncharacterized protein BABINDRAFT_161837 [Babjeviella inositovora NRRL Y-12698]ODQ79437.1 hypothetical protein BABINDRAFT_161837 [Babjeviella inositovora NRRL Y-12698]
MSVPENLFVATYSNVDVYESIVKENSLMRRCKDDWVNATQILKIADFPKPQRTKILEREIQTGTHEKVQGGYGKFQGTWVPLDIAQKLAVQYGLMAMVPVLTFDATAIDPATIPKKVKGSASANPSPKKQKRPKEETPKKPKAAAKKGKPLSLVPEGMKPPTQEEFLYLFHLQGTPVNGTVAPQGITANGATIPKAKMANGGQINGHIPAAETSYENSYLHHPDVAELKSELYPRELMYSYPSAPPTAKQYSESHPEPDLAVLYANTLLEFFSQENSPIPPFILHPPHDFNINDAIDDEGHTPLHWASSIGNLQLMEIILKNGGDPHKPNKHGMNCLSKLTSFNNSYDMRNFGQILELLESCVYEPDMNGRTPVHYVCQFSRNKSKHKSLVYYLRAILDAAAARDMLAAVLDHQDVNGEAALHLAAKASNRAVIQTLIRAGARADLANIHGETPDDLLKRLDSTLTSEFERVSVEDKENRKEAAEKTPENVPADSGIAGRLDTDKLKSDKTINNSEPSAPREPPTPQHLHSVLDALEVTLAVELSDTSRELADAEKLLQSMDAEIAESQEKFQILSNSIGTLPNMRQQLLAVQAEYLAKESHLSRLYERSQAFQLAKFVQIEESARAAHVARGGATDAHALTMLQLARAQTVKEIVAHLSQQNVNPKMNNYRKLISISCGLHVSEIEEMLDGIAQALMATE